MKLVQDLFSCKLMNLCNSNVIFDKQKNIHIHLTAHKTSLCKPSKYKNISFMHFSLIFHPMSLNSKNLTIDNGLNVSNITFKLEITVADVCAMANARIIAKIHFFLNIIVIICVGFSFFWIVLFWLYN